MLRKVNYKERIEKPTTMFVVLAVLYASLLLLSNITAGRLISIWNIILPGAVVIYPLVYIISDIMTEVYGMKLSLLSIKLNVLVNLLMVFVFYIILAIPAPGFFKNVQAYHVVLFQTGRVVFASVTAYFLGDYINSATLSIMKRITNKRYFGLRAVTSTALGQIADTGLFIFLAFYKLIPLNVLFAMMLAQYIFKVSYEAVSLPITIPVVKWWKKKEGLDAIDRKGDYKII